ncbi:MAG: MBL fold metallo-hydrolase [Candidatus Geothermarchaeales archaeon]
MSPGDFGRVSVLVVTHEHYDHLDEGLVRSIYERERCKVVADVQSAGRLSRYIAKEDLKTLAQDGKVEFDAFTLFGEKSIHPAFRPISVVVETKDKLRVYHSSDSAPFDAMRHIPQKYGVIDIAFCTVGIAPGATPKTGAEIAKLVRPILAIPYHGSKLREFCEFLRGEEGIECRIISQGETVILP